MQKRSRGRPAFEPTAEQRKTVMAMAGYGIPQVGIATVIGIDLKTLRKCFREELDKGEVVATSKVAESLYKMATDGNVSAAIFWMKVRAGWSEKVTYDVNIKRAEDMTHDELVTFVAGRSADRGAEEDGDLARARPAGNA